MAHAGATIAVLIVILFGIFFYFIPTFIASHRRHPNRGAIFFLNLVVGWTFVGWLVALVWALR